MSGFCLFPRNFMEDERSEPSTWDTHVYFQGQLFGNSLLVSLGQLDSRCCLEFSRSSFIAQRAGSSQCSSGSPKTMCGSPRSCLTFIFTENWEGDISFPSKGWWDGKGFGISASFDRKWLCVSLLFRQHQEHREAKLWQTTSVWDPGNRLWLWTETCCSGHPGTSGREASVQAWLARWACFD